jgi:hypothetical protein
MSTPRNIRVEAGVPLVTVLSPTLYIPYISHTLQIPGVYLGIFADDIFIYVTDRKEYFILRKLQRGLSVPATWFGCWKIKINEDRTQAIYFSRRLRPPDAPLTLNGRNIPFVNHVKYLGVIFDKKLHGHCT